MIELDALTGGRWAERLAQSLRRCTSGRTRFLAASTSWPVGPAVVGGWAVAAWAISAARLERRDV